MALCSDHPCVGMQSLRTQALKWLRFVGYTIYGREGHISLTENGPPVDYDLGKEGSSYYFSPPGMCSFISLAGPCESHARKRILGF